MYACQDTSDATNPVINPSLTHGCGMRPAVERGSVEDVGAAGALDLDRCTVLRTGHNAPASVWAAKGAAWKPFAS